MEIRPVGPAGSSTARSAMMEIWRMSMTQRIQHEMQQRVSGREHKKEPRKVEPAVRVEISQQAREVAKKQH
jgi:hypothetical protein